MAKQATAPDADQTSDTQVQAAETPVVDLQPQVDQLSAQVTQLTTQVASLSTDRDTLAAANKQLADQLDEKTEELAQAEYLIEEQTAQLKAAEVAQAEGPLVVTYNKVPYRVLAPKFQHNGLHVEARSLATNPDLVRELVEAGSGLLQAVETK